MRLRSTDHPGQRTVTRRRRHAVPFLHGGDASDWDGNPVQQCQDRFVTAIGAGTTYPDYKPAPFIVSSQDVEGADMVTVVTEGIFSYCGVKVKIDTDRHLGPEQRHRACRGRADRTRHHRRVRQPRCCRWAGWSHLTGGSKKSEGRVTCAALLRALQPRGGRDDHRRRPATVTVQAGKAPIVDGVPEHPDARRLRVRCHRHVRRRNGTWTMVDEVDRRRRSHHRASCPNTRRGHRFWTWRRHGDQDQRPPVHPRPLLQGGGPGHRAGAARTYRRSFVHSGGMPNAKKGARPGLTDADGLDHGRAGGLLRAG